MQMTSKPMLIAISAEQADRLYWLGRYVERVFSTVRIFNQSLDRMIDQDGCLLYTSPSPRDTR